MSTTPTSDSSSSTCQSEASPSVTQRPFEAQAQGVVLKGILTLPQGASACEPVPGVVLVHGSGPNSRHSPLPGQLATMFGFEVMLFDDLAAQLAAQGIASVRYDKRTCGAFNGRCPDNGYPMPPEDVSPDHFAKDALAVAAALKQEESVGDLYYVGHSQGGQLTFRALSYDREGHFKGAIMLAPSYKPIDASIRDQIQKSREVSAALGQPSAAVEQALAPLNEVVEQLQQVRQGKYEGQRPVMGASLAFWRDSFAVAEQIDGLVARERRPVLALFGSNDWNVPRDDVQGWRGAFAKSPSQSVRQVIVLNDLSHAMNKFVLDDKGLSPVEMGPGVDTRVSDAISAFIHGRPQPPQSKEP